jgi:hypothetical protein
MGAVAAITFVTPGWSAVRVLAGIVFVYDAPDAPAGAVTCTVITHVPGGAGGEALAGIVPPARVIVDAPGFAVNVPPQEFVVFAGFATINTPGSVSEIPTPV